MINYKGDLLPKNTLYLDSVNRGFSHGDVLCFYFRALNGKIMFLESHYFQLMASMRQLRMEVSMDFTMEFLEQQSLYLTNACGLTQTPSRIKFSVFRESWEDTWKNRSDIGYIIEAEPLSSAKYNHFQNMRYRADLFKDHLVYKDSLSSLTLNALMIPTLASIYKNENGLQTCILLNNEREVCDSLDGTLYVRFGSTIITPDDKSGCKHSVLRTQFNKFLNESVNFNLETRAVSPFDLPKADELFSLGELSEFRSISHYKKTSYSYESASQLAQKFHDWIVSRENIS
jgi:branched-chain amino acid aminotransferase